MEQERLTQLPMARIRTVMKTSPDMGIINQEALFLMCRSAEMFIEHMAKGSHKAGSKSLDYKDLAEYVQKNDNLEFLQQILPVKITVKQYRELMAKKRNPDSDTESEEEEEAGGDEEAEVEEEEEVITVEDDDDKKKEDADSEDSASSSGESNSVISIDSSSDEKENSKNVTNKKLQMKHKTGDSP
ncbi:chromatin accessibility complex protein 1 [Anopheles ziemanni]|uniref:chromatin accessibility complex protein 1 n=1 Tax=Anopheles coustani TaxID=139045 RepID=UPI002658079E|nr:chromatin accessibility complex protein 1 [Anopheles coustani]XP_058166308.1 chromatin accessibility complex protein 1 [Anopheles ziemanni]